MRFWMDVEFVQYETDIDEYLNSIEPILKFFKDNRQHMLIWNPHPMILYYEIREEEQAARYEKLIGIVKSLPNVQYGVIESNLRNDLPPDAFIRSNIYENDIYNIQEEAVYFANSYMMKRNEGEEKLYFLDCDCDGEQAWLVGRYVPGVFSIDLNTWEIKLRHMIGLKEKYLTLRKKGNHVYVFRYAAKVLDINLVTNEEKEIEFVNWEKYIKFPSKLIIQEIIEYEEEYFIIPAYSGLPLLKFDGVKLEECHGWKEKIEEYLGKERSPITEGVVQVDSKIWMLVPNTNRMIVTDLKNISVEMIEIEGLNCKSDIIGFDGHKFWLAPSSEGAFIQWEKEKGIEKKNIIFPQKFSFSEDHSFVKIVFYQEKVFFIPRRASDILIFDKNKEEMRCIELKMFDWSGEKQEKNFLKFCAALELDNKLILFACGMPKHLVIDMEREKIAEVIDLVFEIDDLYLINKMFFDTYKICKSNLCSFSQFAAILEQNKLEKEINIKECTENEDSHKCIGEKIWKAVKKELLFME